LKKIYTQSLPEFCFSSTIEGMSASIYESYLLGEAKGEGSAVQSEVMVTEESVTLIDPLSYVLC
jgi:hypothetical protein